MHHERARATVLFGCDFAAESAVEVERGLFEVNSGFVCRIEDLWTRR